MNENENSILSRLTAPFNPMEIRWRPTLSGTKNGKPWCLVIPFVNSDTLMSRLDSVLGSEHWSVSYGAAPGNGILCTLKIRIASEWIEKSGVAGITSEIEPVKSAATGAFKKACVAFGIGRSLQNVGNQYGIVSENGAYKGSARDKATNTFLNFRWDPPTVAQPESKSIGGWEIPPKPQPKSAPVPPKREEAARREPTYEELPVSLRQIFEDVKIGKVKALEMCRRKKFDYDEITRIINEILPDVGKPAAA